MMKCAGFGFVFFLVCVYLYLCTCVSAHSHPRWIKIQACKLACTLSFGFVLLNAQWKMSGKMNYGCQERGYLTFEPIAHFSLPKLQWDPRGRGEQMMLLYMVPSLQWCNLQCFNLTIFWLTVGLSGCNPISTYDIFNLEWVYPDVTPS